MGMVASHVHFGPPHRVNLFVRQMEKQASAVGAKLAKFDKTVEQQGKIYKKEVGDGAAAPPPPCCHSK
jgi:hypothetical protein